MDPKARAKEAALAQINDARQKLIDYTRQNYPLSQFEIQIDFIKSKITEYSLDNSVLDSILSDVYQELMKQKRHVIAEKLASKYISGPDHSTTPKEKSDVTSISIDFGCLISATLGFGILLLTILLICQLYWLISLAITIAYLYCHPHIGKWLYLVAKPACLRVDNVFNLSDSQSWAKTLTKYALYFTATWPVLAPPIIIAATICSEFGSIYKNLFK